MRTRFLMRRRCRRCENFLDRVGQRSLRRFVYRGGDDDEREEN